MDRWKGAQPSNWHRNKLAPPRWPQVPTLVGAVCMCLVTVVPAVIVPITGPVLGDAASAVALELGARARVAAASLVTIVPTVIVWGGEARGGEASKGSASNLLCDHNLGPPLPLANPTLGPPQPPTEKKTNRKDTETA